MKTQKEISYKKILITNLHKEISSEDLRKCFKDCGEIIKINLIKHQIANDAEIFFIGAESVKNALKKNNTYLKESILTIAEVARKYTPLKSKKEIFPSKKLKKKEIINEDDDDEDNDNEGDYESNCSESKEYAAFMKEYKHYHNNIKKMLREKVKSNKKEENDPNLINLPELLKKANGLYLSNKHDEAIEILHTIISAAPDLQEPYQILSQIYEERNDISTALSFLMLAAQLSNGDIEIWLRCASLNKSIKNLQQAEYCITRALKLQKKNIYILYERGSLNEEMGNLFKAARVYETLISYYPNLEILIHTALIREKVGNHEKAISLIEKYIDKVDKKLNALIVLYDFYIKYNSFEKGVKMNRKIILQKEYEKALIDPKIQIRILMCYIVICIKYKGDIEYLNSLNIKDNSEDELVNQMLIHFYQLISNESGELDILIDNIHKLFYLMESLERIGLFIDIFDKIERKITEIYPGNAKMRLNELNPEIYSKIGEYYFNSKAYKKSIHFYEKCLSSKPDTLYISLKLSEAYGKIEENDKALEVLNRTTYAQNNITNQTTKDAKDDDKSSISDVYNINNQEEEIDRNNLLSNQLYRNNSDIKNEIMNEDTFQQNEYDNMGNYDNVNKDIESLNIGSDLIIENTAMGIPTVFSNQYLHPYISQSKFLGKKRLNISSRLKYKDKVVIDLNFDNFLHSKMRKLINGNSKNKAFSYSNISNSNQTLKDLKREFEELSDEVSKNRNLYIKLQESIVYLNAKNIKKFYQNTFYPLKQVLNQELKIENYKTDLFNYVLEKSLIKNYFLKRNSLFDQKGMEEDDVNLPLNEALKPIGQRDFDRESALNEEENKFFEKKDNLFLRKTANKYFLTKKKVTPAIELVEKQVKSLDNIEKFINPENFFRLIEQFIFYSYKFKKYRETHHITALLFNSKNFLSRNDSFSYNLFLYSIMASFKIKQYKIAYELIKRNIIRYSIQDITFFWMQLWNAGRKVPSSTVRAFMYKLRLNKNISSNKFLKVIVASCYFQSHNYDIALNLFQELIEEHDSPFLYLMVSLSYLFWILNRKSIKREMKYIKAMRFFNLYASKRMVSFPLEVSYNLGRLYQFIGLDQLAYQKYMECFVNLNNVLDDQFNKDDKHKMKMSVAYNMAMLVKKGGNEEQAHKLIYDNIII